MADSPSGSTVAITSADDEADLAAAIALSMAAADSPSGAALFNGTGTAVNSISYVQDSIKTSANIPADARSLGTASENVDDALSLPGIYDIIDHLTLNAKDKRICIIKLVLLAHLLVVYSCPDHRFSSSNHGTAFLCSNFFLLEMIMTIPELCHLQKQWTKSQLGFLVKLLSFFAIDSQFHLYYQI